MRFISWASSLLAVLATVAVTSVAGSNNAGFKVAIGESAIEYTRDNVLLPMLDDFKKDLMEKNHATQIPYSQRSFKLTKLGVDWIDAKLLRISLDRLSIHRQKTTIDFIGDSKLKVIIKDLNIKLSASGYINGDRLALSATVGDADLELTVTLGAKQGYPTARVSNAKLNVDEDEIDIVFTDGLGILRPALNAISGWCNGLMADAAEDAFKQHYGKVNAPIAEVLKSVPLTHTIKDSDIPAVKLTKDIISRLSLTTAPETTSKLLVLYFDVHAYLKGRKACASSCTPRNTPNPVAATHFVQIGITDTLPCCILTAASELGLLQFEGDIPQPEIQLPSEYSTGLSPVVDAIFARYPISFKAEVIGVPKLTFSKSKGISLNARIKAIGFIDESQGEGEKTAAVDVTVDVAASARVSINGNKINYRLSNAALRLVNIKSLVPELDPVVQAPLQDLVDVIISTKVLPKVNEMLSKGYTLPVVQGASFVNPSLTVETGRLLVQTDFKYVKPDAAVDQMLLMLQRGEGPPEEADDSEESESDDARVTVSSTITNEREGIVAGVASAA